MEPDNAVEIIGELILPVIWNSPHIEEGFQMDLLIVGS